MLINHLNYNPDVLSCLANLSSDEVFTQPKTVDAILDLLPEELWSNPDTKFLDPVCKTGVFLREIARRLEKGLATKIPDKQARLNHIFTNQVYGIAITDITAFLSRRSIYCSKKANGKYSVCTAFKNEAGNIFFQRVEHSWESNGRCAYCNANKENYERDESLESHAYMFIHQALPEELQKMKFDVIIGNPPYQLNDGGYGRSASPIYHKFVQQAKKLKPRYLSMIIPSRWFAGGKGLNEFREEMLNDSRLRKLVDFENSADVFPGVDVAGGICYFLWERDYKGECEVVNMYNDGSVTSVRPLNEFDILIRHSMSIPIIRKVLAKEGKNKKLDDVVSPRKPFGLPTNYKPRTTGIPCWYIQRIGKRYAKSEDVEDRHGLLDKWKLLIPKAPIAGQTDFSKPIRFYYEANTRIATPGECCTESWLVAGAFSTEEELLSFKSYLFTKTVQFLLLQTVISQDVSRGNFRLIPDLGSYKGEFDDETLSRRWDLTEEEWAFIDAKMRDPLETNE